MSTMNSRELVIVMGLVIYGFALVVSSLFVGSRVALAAILSLGLVSGHAMVFFAGYTQFMQSYKHHPHAEKIFFVGIQLLLLAQDLIPLRLVHGPSHGKDHLTHHPPQGSVGEKSASLLAFQIMYSVIEVCGTIMVLKSFTHVEFNPKHSYVVHRTGLNRTVKSGIVVGIIGSAFYSLSNTPRWHYVGTGLIALSGLLCAFGFFALRFAWFGKEHDVESATPIVGLEKESVRVYTRYGAAM
jgi:hypothetical protein